jgi:membrane associated rhomboid family serine protease
MSARRWPVITLGLIVVNTLVFLATHGTMQDEARPMGVAKLHIVALAAAHPGLKVARHSQKVIDDFKQRFPSAWDELQDPNHKLIDPWDQQTRQVTDPDQLQSEMDSLTNQYENLSSTTITGRYAFTPGNPTLISYVTSMFLHGGWLHLIGNMWFLWLAGFVLEDVWGRPLFITFYLIAGMAATQFHAWTNLHSMQASLGASGAVAGLMGAFLVRFPKMKIEMAWVWLFGFRTYRFKAAAYWLLPIWLLMEILYGGLLGTTTGVAHWAHVGGFVFGVLFALAIQHSGFEHVVNAAIEEKVGATADPELEQASQLMDQDQFDEAVIVLNNYLAAKPDSIDGLNLLRAIYHRRGEMPAYQEASLRTLKLHLKLRHDEAAWSDYEEYLKAGGGKLPAVTWLDIGRALENGGHFDRALGEYQNLIAAYPKDRESLMAQLAAARICLKRLDRPQDSLAFYQAAAASPIPHLDLEQTIAMGIREAKSAMTQAKAASV